MAESDFKVIYENGTGEIVEKKSRFIANVFKVENEEQVSSYINAIKKRYWDARHNCFAYVIGNNNEIQRFSDDGEPSGTAGKPILEVITGNNLHNCLIVVTRYFGGTLLGTGGLLRAYQGAAKEGVTNSVLATRISGNSVTITTDYTGLGKIQYVIEQMELTTPTIEYTDVVSINVTMPESLCEELLNKITEVTSGRAKIGKIKSEDIIVVNKHN